MIGSGAAVQGGGAGDAGSADFGVSPLFEDLRTLIAQCPAVLYRCDWDQALTLRFVSANVGTLTGLDAALLLGTPGEWERRIHADDRAALADMRATLAQQGRAVREYRFRRADGEWRWFHDECALALRPDGTTEVVGSVLDVSDRHALQAQLSQALRLEAIGSLAAGIAHEINTPAQFVSDNVHFLGDAFSALLQVVEADAAALAADGVPPEARASAGAARAGADLDFLLAEVPPALEQAKDGLQRIAKIVQAVKRFAHPVMDAEEPVELGPLLEAALNVTRNEWKYSCEAVLELAADLPVVLAVPGELQQVFLNLIVNSAHAIADKRSVDGGAPGVIRITARTDGPQHVLVAVADSGSGIPEAIRHRIFEPFFTTKEVGRGSGQGLAQVWAAVVDQHKGQITVESTIGVGTTFILRLPVHGRHGLPA